MDFNPNSLHPHLDEHFMLATPFEACKKYDKREIHKHDYYEIIWVISSESSDDTILIDFAEYPIEENKIYLISAGHLHRFNPANKRGWIITLSKSFYYGVTPQDLQNRSTFLINSIINKNRCDKCNTLLLWIVEEATQSKRCYLLEAYFRPLFILLTPSFEKNTNSDHNKQLVAELLNLIETNYIEQRNVKFYADSLGLSEKSANEVCKEVTQKTIKQKLQERLILEIRREIVSNKLTFKELAYKLGFNEASYFTRFFKTQTGFTPEEYKTFIEKHLEK